MKRALWVLLCLVLLASPSLGEQVDVGKQISNSKNDLKYIDEDKCNLGYDKKGKHLYCYPITDGGGGSVLTPRGVSMEFDYFEEVVPTVEGEEWVDTTNMIPGGSTVQRCMAFTINTVNGGYLLGIDGAETAYATMPGVANEDSLNDLYRTPPHHIFEDHQVRVSAPPPSTFPDSSGQVLVTCIWTVFTAATPD